MFSVQRRPRGYFLLSKSANSLDPLKLCGGLHITKRKCVIKNRNKWSRDKLLVGGMQVGPEA